MPVLFTAPLLLFPAGGWVVWAELQEDPREGDPIHHLSCMQALGTRCSNTPSLKGYIKLLWTCPLQARQKKKDKDRIIQAPPCLFKCPIMVSRSSLFEKQPAYLVVKERRDSLPAQVPGKLCCLTTPIQTQLENFLCLPFPSMPLRSS